MGRFVAIDYGTKRTGIAVTDPLQMIATPLDTVPTHELMAFLSEYIRKEGIERLIVGLPLQMNYTQSGTLKFARQFAAAFKKRYPAIPVEWIDERFTSKLAAEAMISGGMKKSQRQKKEHHDRISAAIILQSYLEQQNNIF
ncbi:MAG: Holliday junction resolvase RuvX [Bacteroidales bacterium]|nr:Holliday junction resolvase RuvX [Bacteroidales bacterium]MBN2699507.1 Holliday junction resolvase RuvX [Bacteroidales bacterium]